MELFITIVVTFFAGMGAGLGTGFAGMSAAAVITPMRLLLMFWRVPCPHLHMDGTRIWISKTDLS